MDPLSQGVIAAVVAQQKSSKKTLATDENYKHYIIDINKDLSYLMQLIELGF